MTDPPRTRPALDIADLIAPDRVLLSFGASDKRQLLRDLAQRAARQLGLAAQPVIDALLARETLGSTGVGQGIALPHSRLAGLDHFFGLFARLARPIEFDAIDHRPIDLVFLLLTPERPGSEHLAALAAISRRLREPAVAARLRAAKSAPDLYAALTEP